MSPSKCESSWYQVIKSIYNLHVNWWCNNFVVKMLHWCPCEAISQGYQEFICYLCFTVSNGPLICCWPLHCLHIASMLRGSLITSFLLLHMFPCIGTLISIEIWWTTKLVVLHANLNNENLKCFGILTKPHRSYSRLPSYLLH